MPSTRLPDASPSPIYIPQFDTRRNPPLLPQPPTMKTYSRLKKSTYLSSEPPAKRRRILCEDDDEDDALHHSSSNATLLRSDALSTPRIDTSDSTLPPSTPPSSPPPAPGPTTLASPLLPLPTRRPTFSFFARKTTAAARPPPPPPPPNAATEPIAQPLSEQRDTNASANADAGPEESSAVKATKKKKMKKGPQQQQRRLTQLQLDLGMAPVQRTCKTCGMAYVPSNAEDAALHKRFHAMNVGGVEVGRAFARSSNAERMKGGGGGGEVVWEKGTGDGDVVVAVGRRDRAAARTRVKRVLEVVERELGAVEIPDEELWMQVVLGGREDRWGKSEERVRVKAEEETELQPQRSRSTANGAGAKKAREKTLLCADRFKAYLYIRGSKCIGLCLAERITEAYRVVPPPPDTKEPSNASKVDSHTTSADDSSQPTTKESRPTPRPSQADASTAIVSSPSPQPAHLGISRIWVSSSHRLHGVATALLDAATRDFCDYRYYHEDQKRPPKEGVAFSQPTENGTRLARRWFGTETGWAVYW